MKQKLYLLSSVLISLRIAFAQVILCLVLIWNQFTLTSWILLSWWKQDCHAIFLWSLSFHFEQQLGFTSFSFNNAKEEETDIYWFICQRYRRGVIYKWHGNKTSQLGGSWRHLGSCGREKGNGGGGGGCTKEGKPPRHFREEMRLKHKESYGCSWLFMNNVNPVYFLTRMHSQDLSDI